MTHVKDLTPNTKEFRFALPSDKHELGLPVSGFVLAKLDGDDGKPVVKPYTPTSEKNAKGYMDLVIKIYPNGKFGQLIKNKKVGDEVEIKGPIVKYEYKANEYERIGMLAGGI